MSVWFAIPSAREPAEANECLSKWKALGYRVAVFRDIGHENGIEADIVMASEYRGYANAVNDLCREILREDPHAEWIATGGDDMHPIEGRTADEIARECNEHFGGTLGIMQATGDRWMVDRSGRCSAERVCVSPWMGREWCERAYLGQGPLYHGYLHFFVDEELHEVASATGLLWHRPDLMQYHDNWMRVRGRERPAFLDKAKNDWDNAKRLFRERKEAGFPGSELRA